MKSLLLLYNDLLDEETQEKLALPLEFIAFAYIEGVMMYEFEGKCYALPQSTSTKYNRVYGALYILDNSEKYLRVLDAYMMCSKGLIGLNHKLDRFHREYVQATPIHFKSVEQFLKLSYTEGEQVKVISYLGNNNNEVIRAKVSNKTQNRVTCGFDINNYINLVMKKEN